MIFRFGFFCSLIMLSHVASGVPLSFNGLLLRLEQVPEKCIMCKFYQETRLSPYSILSGLSSSLSDISETMKNELLLSEDVISNAESVFHNYCQTHCFQMSRMYTAKSGNNCGVDLDNNYDEPLVDESILPVGQLFAEPDEEKEEISSRTDFFTNGNNESPVAGQYQSPLPMYNQQPQWAPVTNQQYPPSYQQQQFQPYQPQQTIPVYQQPPQNYQTINQQPMQQYYYPVVNEPSAPINPALNNYQNQNQPNQTATAVGVSNLEGPEKSGKGVAVVSKAGASLIGAGLGQTGDISGAVEMGETGETKITAAVLNSGYVSGAATNQGTASAASDINENGMRDLTVVASEGASGIGLTGGEGGFASGKISTYANGTSNAAITTKEGSEGGAVYSSGAGAGASSSNQGLSLKSTSNHIASGVSSVGEAAGSLSIGTNEMGGSVASSGGSSSVGSVSGQAIVGSTVTNETMTNVVSSIDGRGSSMTVIGEAAGSSFIGDGSIANSVSSNKGTASGTSVLGKGYATAEKSDNKTIIASASSEGGMASSAMTSGKGAAGSAGDSSSGLTIGVTSDYGAASGTAIGKGASVASSAGKTANIALFSSKNRGAVAKAISSRFMPMESTMKSRRVKTLRKHCGAEF